MVKPPSAPQSAAQPRMSRDAMILGIREKQFQAWVEQAAKLLGWRVYHTYDSRRSAPGFPDLCMVHATQGRLVFAELKTQTGRVSKAQREWLDDLQTAGQECFIWRPQDWVNGTIHQLLQHPE